LTAARGVASWIASLRDTRVSPSASRASGKGRKTLAISGRMSRASSAKSSPSGCFSKTSAGTYDWDFAKSQKSYDAWVIALRRDCLQRRKSARRIAESDCSHWPTVKANEHAGCAALPKSGKHEMGLDQQSRTWPTPCAQFQPRGRNYTKSGGHTKPHDLTTAVSQWPTPNANNGKGVQNVEDCKRQGHQVKLQDVAVSSFRLVPTSSTPGAKSSPSARKLNPLFVEALMGLPLGWTDYTPLASTAYAHWETASCRWLQDMRGRDSEAPLSKAA
jgi:DNA (cytosine-5)-methyltransferase 1